MDYCWRGGGRILPQVPPAVCPLPHMLGICPSDQEEQYYGSDIVDGGGGDASELPQVLPHSGSAMPCDSCLCVLGGGRIPERGG